MRLVFYLSVGDFLLAVGGNLVLHFLRNVLRAELPYIIYMTINWHHDVIDYDPLYIMITAQPLPIQLKVSATITVGIALSRNIVSLGA